LNPPLPSPGSYLLWIDRATGTAGQNDFYGINAFGGFDDDPPEKETTAGQNDTIALADASEEELVLLGSPPTARFIAYLPAGDVDYVGFEVLGPVTIEAFCGAESSGSGLRALSAEVRDATDTVVVGGTEPAILDANLPAAGRYYFRLAAGAQDPDVTGNWVRCTIRLP
jgi:hypothetical protein